MGDEVTSKSDLVQRLGVIGDVHTESARLAGVLTHFATLKLDRILCTGDLPDGPGLGRDVDACCKLLQQAGVLTISGNHDRWFLDAELRELDGATMFDDVSRDTLAFLRGLPQTAELSTPTGLLLLCHGLGSDDMASVRPFDHGRALDDNEALQALLRQQRYRYVVNGHTHRHMVRSFGALTLVNAGTLLRDHGPCCAVLDFVVGEARFFVIESDGSMAEGHTYAL
jgi:predicted phosphodiesterase